MNKENSGLCCLVTLLKLNNKMVDVTQLQHQWIAADGSITVTDMIRALTSFDLKAKKLSCDIHSLKNEVLPAIGITQEGTFFVLLRVPSLKNSDQCLIMMGTDKTPTSITLQALNKLWSGSIIVARENDRLKDKNTFSIRWFLPAIRKYRRLFIEVVVISFFLQLFSLATPFFFQIVMDKVLVHRGFTTLDILAIGFMGIALFDALMGTIRNYLFSHTTSRIDAELGSKLFAHVMRLPIAYFESRQVGHTVARVKELDTLREFITGSALTLLIDLSFLFVFIAILWLYSPTLTWVVIGAIPLYVLVSALITPSLRNRLNESFKRGAENQAFLVESISGVDTVKSLSLEPQMQRTWERLLANFISAGFKAKNLSNIASQIAQLISKTTTILIIWFGAHLVIAGTLSIGELIAFNMIASRVSAPILKLVQLWQDFQQAGISLKRLGEILNTPTEIAHSANKASLPTLNGEIDIKELNFRYSPNAPLILKDISIHIKAGESLGIVGGSGSGKSTLTRLIQRMYLPERGRITLDGLNLSQANTDWLRGHIGVVPQDSFLFQKSVRENIALGAPGASLEEVSDAAKLSGAHGFITELSEAYETNVGERGCHLSGGQRQRIAIARALITHPRILILDEATSALDYESESEIQRNMHRIKQGRTVITIAHRLSTVRHCDRIIVLHEGQVAEEGSHDELVQLNGIYSRMLSLQAGESSGLSTIEEYVA